MKKHFRQYQTLLLSFLLLTLTACGGGSSGDDETKETINTVDISGVVTGSGGLVDVTVLAGGKSTVTDNNGVYLLEDVPVPDDGRVVVTYKKAGYGTYQRSLLANSGEQYALEAKLLRYQLSENINNGTQAQTLTSSDGQGTRVSLTLDNNALPSDDVTINIATGDPTTEEGRAVFPGDYMAATAAGESPDTPLESIAYTEITITDDNGDELTTLAKPAALKVRLPDTFQTGGERAGTYVAGDSEKGFIEWWSYDEDNATWIREDADPSTAELDNATVVEENGTLYAQAMVTHFSWWNADHPIGEHACLCVTVVDENNQPVTNALVIAEGVTYTGRSTPQKTDDNGKTCVTVKRTTNPATPEQVKIFVEYGGVKFYYDVTNTDEGDVDNDLVNTPEVQGSTLSQPATGQCKNLENNITPVFAGTVTGNISYEGGTPANNFTLHSSFGTTTTSDSQGNYSMNTPLDVEVMLFAPGLVSKTVTTTQGEPNKVVDFVIENRAPIIENLSRTPTGLINVGSTVTLKVEANDPDNDPITYSWNLSGSGSLNKTSGDEVIWTAPASGTGDDSITVTVADNKGKQTSRTTIINWGDSSESSSFKLTIMNNLTDKQPVPDVVVAVYSTDNQSIERTKTTNAQGVADFGSLSVNRASITLAVTGPGQFKYITTFVDMPLGTYVYYLDDDLDIGQFFCVTPTATATMSATSMPAGSAITVVQPTNTLLTQVSPSAPTKICDEFIQNDGKISLLARSVSSLFDSTLIRYEYLLDQTVSDGATYTFDMANGKLPLTVQLNNTGILPTNASISAMRKDILYYLGTATQINSENTFLLTAGEFPADYYIVDAFGQQTATGVSLIKRYNNLPQSVQTNMPDYNFTNTNFDEGTNTFSWTLTGTAAKDHFNLMLMEESEMGPVEWNIFLPETATNWKVMPLPAPANTWVDTTKLNQQFFGASLQVIDYDTLTGADEVIRFFANGGSFNDAGSINSQQMGETTVELGSMLFKPSLKATTEQMPKKPTAIHAVGGVRGFVRQ